MKFLPLISEVITIKTERVKELIEDDPHKFYNSTAWKKKRQEILERDNHECVYCKRKGGFSNVNLQVHHEKELLDRPDLAFDNENLVTICGRCHSSVHNKIEKMRRNNKFKKKKPITPERW